MDRTGKLAGRGAYVCRDDACITTALGRGLLGRALDAPIPASLPSELLATVTPTTIPGGPRGQE
jgi:predicted RNA-binding protein YlxR (DUF448 family)